MRLSALLALLLATPAVAQNMDGMAMPGMAMPAESFSFGAPAPAEAATRTIKVTMTTLRFEPSQISIRKGEAVRFIVTNTSDLTHEFILGDAATQRAHQAEMAKMPNMTMDADPNAITVKPHTTATLTWRFTGAASLEYACDIPGHYQGGMHGVITVR